MESSPSTELTTQSGKNRNSSAPEESPSPPQNSTGPGTPGTQPSAPIGAPGAQTEANPNSESPKPKSPWFKRVLLTVGLVALIGAAIWGFDSWQFGSRHVSTDDAYLTSDIVQITPQVAGSLVELPARENQHVKKGDLLARLDDATFQAELEQAKANLASAQATVASSSLNVSLTQATGSAQIQQAQGGVGQTDRAIAGAQADVKRVAAAIQSAQAQRDGALANIRSAQAAAVAAVAAKNRAVAVVTGATAQVAVSQAAVRTAEANLAQARANSEKANKDAARYAVLYDQDAISAQTLDTANAAAKSALAQVVSQMRQIEQALSTVDARLADVAAAQDQVKAADANVLQSQAMIASARDAAAAAAAAVTQNRAQLQVGKEAVGQQVARREQAVGVLDQARTAPKQVEVSQSSVSANRTRIAQAQAALKTAQINLNRTRLFAPFDGTISKKTGEIGQQVAVGQQIMALVPDNDVWVVANFKETQLKKVRVGQDVEVEVDALSGQKFRGHVDSISAGTGSTFALLPTDNATGNFTKVVQRVAVKIVFDRDQKGIEALRAGLSVLATISTGK